MNDEQANANRATNSVEAHKHRQDVVRQSGSDYFVKVLHGDEITEWKASSISPGMGHGGLPRYEFLQDLPEGYKLLEVVDQPYLYQIVKEV